MGFLILQVHGALPFQKCKAALDAVRFSDVVTEEELGSYFADIVTQLALDVSYFNFPPPRGVFCDSFCLWFSRRLPLIRKQLSSFRL